MGRDADEGAGPDVAPGSARGLLWRAALLAGHGPQARELADALLACTRDASSRTCLDAGARLQLLVEAPGDARLHVGLRLGARPDRGALAAVLGDDAARRVLELHERAGDVALADGPTWLWWHRDRHELVVPLDPARGDAAAALASAIAADRGCAPTTSPRAGGLRPWAIALSPRAAGTVATRIAWLIPRERPLAELLAGAAPESWPRARQLATRLLGRDVLGGRWMMIDAPEGARGLCVGSTAWSLVPEDMRKHDTFGRACGELGGVQSWAESLWTLCRANAGPRWRVGRAFELRIAGDEQIVRWFLAPPCS